MGEQKNIKDSKMSEEKIRKGDTGEKIPDERQSPDRKRNEMESPGRRMDQEALNKKSMSPQKRAQEGRSSPSPKKPNPDERKSSPTKK